MGLVHHLVSTPSNFGARLSEVILECLLAGPEAARRTKGLLLQGVPLPDEGLTEFTISAIAEARASAEGQAGLSAFLEKQPAPWRAGLPQGAGRP
jgi:methylglutaconyl-CoA hydratase